MSDKFITTWFQASKGTYTKDVGIIGTKFKEFTSERYVNIDEYSDYLAQAYNKLDSKGYDVVNVVPITIGQSDRCEQRDETYVGDVGFSITSGAVIVGKRRE